MDVGQWEIFVPALVLAQNEYSRATQDWVIALSLPAAFADINIRKSWSVYSLGSAAICPLERIMMHGLPVLLGLIVLALTTAGQENHAYALSIRLHRGTPLEERGREQLG